MRQRSAFRLIALSAIAAVLLAGALATRGSAQSDLMRGDRMPYDAFDRMPKTDLDVPSGVIHVVFAPGEFALPKDKILQWVATSAKAVSIYYGRFPVKSLKLLFVPVDGSRVQRRHDMGISRRCDPDSARPRCQH